MFRRRRGQVWATLSDSEIQILRDLITQYLQLLDSDPDPADPVRARLFPSASMDDPTVDRDYRDLAGSDLDAHKRATAQAVLGSLDALTSDIRGEISAEQQDAWLVVLTDLRLALGVRLAVTEDMPEAPLDLDDPTQWALAVYHFLGALQESLVQALAGALPHG